MKIQRGLAHSIQVQKYGSITNIFYLVDSKHIGFNTSCYMHQGYFVAREVKEVIPAPGTVLGPWLCAIIKQVD